MKLFLTISLSISGIFTLVAQQPVADLGKGKKLALVIGVSSRSSVTPMNSIYDAMDISAALSRLGFSVHTLKDPHKRTIDDAVRSLEKEMKDASTCLFYFSGHGIGYEGENYLLPSDAAPRAPADLEKQAYRVTDILTKMEKAKVPTSIVILDACRQNPYSSLWRAHCMKKHGLVETYPTGNTFIGYASAPGQLSMESRRRNSTFTAALLKFITSSTVSLDRLFNEVAREVRTSTCNQQAPFKISSLTRDFFFLRRSDSKPPPKKNTPETLPHFTTMTSDIRLKRYPAAALT